VKSLFEFFPEPFQIGVLDVGAALTEQPPYQSLLEAGRARLVGFEADTEECERLNQTYGAPHRFFPYFVGDGKEGTFHQTNWVLTGSLYPPNTPLLEKFQTLAEVVTPVGTQAVTTRRLDDIDGVGDVDLIKIDVQGAELKVLENGLRALSGALMVHTEVEFVEIYKGQPLFAEMDQFLRRQGFQFHTFAQVAGRAFKPLVPAADEYAPFRQALWADAVYVRDWMRLEALPAEKLRNYAILAHDLLGSVDLAHLVLAALDRKTGSSHAPAYLKQVAPG
jgi:FkbM family methyltransferase